MSTRTYTDTRTAGTSAMALAVMTWLLLPTPAMAQPLGTFRWQLEPYCNIVTLEVTRNGRVFQIAGTDDQCGAAKEASAVSTAFVNPDGSIGLGLGIVTAPSGTPVHVEAAIDLSTLSGTWHDSAGHSGAFTFTPGAGTGGSPRPIATLGLSGVTLGFGLASSGGPGNVTLSTNLEQIKTGLEMRTSNVEFAWNLGLGPRALAAAQPGAGANVAIGERALELLTTGELNVAVGARSLNRITTGARNIGVGVFAMPNNQTGSSNVALGAGALGSAVSGDDNVAIGDAALFPVRTGSRNIGIGYQAGSRGCSGTNNNIYIGRATGSAPTTTRSASLEDGQRRFGITS